MEVSDYIKRTDAIDAVCGWGPNDLTEAIRADIETIPAADVRPVERGKWEDVEVTDFAGKTTLPITSIVSMRCPKCNRYHNEVYFYGCATEHIHFCPNCGADMRGESDV